MKKQKILKYLEKLTFSLTYITVSMYFAQEINLK